VETAARAETVAWAEHQAAPRDRVVDCSCRRVALTTTVARTSAVIPVAAVNPSNRSRLPMVNTARSMKTVIRNYALNTTRTVSARACAHRTPIVSADFRAPTRAASGSVCRSVNLQGLARWNPTGRSWAALVAGWQDAQIQQRATAVWCSCSRLRGPSEGASDVERGRERVYSRGLCQGLKPRV